LLDLSHFPLLKESVHATVSSIGKWAGHVHIGSTVTNSDLSRYGDTHPYFGFAEGVNDTDDIADFLNALANIGYFSRNKKNTLGMEIIPMEQERPQDIIMNGKRTLRRAWQQFTKRNEDIKS
jgi:hypothetical protein